MRKKLFDRYAELSCYRLAVKQLYRNKIITRTQLRAVESEIAQAEMSLIVPKRNKIHPRKMTCAE